MSFVLVIPVLVLSLILYMILRWDTHRRERLIKTHLKLEKTTISGYFEHEETKSTSRFSYVGDDTFIRHRIGTSTSLNDTWVYDTKNKRYVNKPIKYGKLEKGVFSIYEKGTNELLERLVRYKVDCPCFKSEKPTKKNIATLYDVCRVHEDESDEFASLLTIKKKCIVFHDWNLSENMELVSQGVFLVDKKRTCFFYVPEYLYKEHEIKENSVAYVSVEDLSPLLFAGVLIE